MKNLLNKISDSEKERILEMHKNAIRKNLVSEQGTPTSGLGSTAAGSQTTTPTQTTTTNQTTGQQNAAKQETPPSQKTIGVKGKTYYLPGFKTPQDVTDFITISQEELNKFNTDKPFLDFSNQKTLAAKQKGSKTPDETFLVKYILPGLSSVLDAIAQMGVIKNYRDIVQLKNDLTSSNMSSRISPETLTAVNQFIGFVEQQKRVQLFTNIVNSLLNSPNRIKYKTTK